MRSWNPWPNLSWIHLLDFRLGCYLFSQDKCEGAGFYHRLILIEQQFKGAGVLMHKLGYLPLGFRQLWANERLLNIVEQFIGPDIAGATYFHFQI